jgi:hypothetical protein
VACGREARHQRGEDSGRRTAWGSGHRCR